ncbi:zinc finger A20 and AN1 domain-containing stress-associated protein 5-like [Gossypium australe]|uniref:Zinc finger A20 and AN1 domain-containing stress-associated protein 5-like n=1 Tax=Gossypium australe TaxID=47621 RepID=A0A5B6VX60_9ROSI|nr:zinc finger A20 and AN1 domain-containing stress-associated protein 5-like [Gossypium australe]
MVTTTPLCANGCGFHGSVDTKDLSSNSPKSAKMNDPTSSAAEPGPSDSVVSATLISSPSKINNRCESCNRKLGLMGFTCRCGKVFCQFHRYPLELSCNYDFKKAGRRGLAKENPVIRGDKLKSGM